MFKYLFALVAASVIGISVADAQTYHHRNHTTVRHTNRQVRVIVQHPTHRGFKVVRYNYNFCYAHTPNVALYGTFAQYQQFGVAVVGYSDLAAVQGYCGQQGMQIVQVNPVQSFVVVRLPAGYGWHGIQTFSKFQGVCFVEPGVRRY